MNTYIIENTRSGHVFGRYHGNTVAEALDAMARDAGHASYADLQEEVPAAPGEIKVTECEPYTARFGHSDNDAPGQMTLYATSESEAIKEANRFVEDGMRNGTWINVNLGNGAYAAANRHGVAVGEVTRYS